MRKQAKYEYTIGGGVAGALAGAALTKLLEDEDRKATLADYLTGGGIGLGLGALGGRTIEYLSTPDKSDYEPKPDKADKKTKTEDDEPTETSTLSPVALTSAIALPLTGTGVRFFANKALQKARANNLKDLLKLRRTLDAARLSHETGKFTSDFTATQSALSDASYDMRKALKTGRELRQAMRRPTWKTNPAAKLGRGLQLASAIPTAIQLWKWLSD